jgi:hypothetical protein
VRGSGVARPVVVADGVIRREAELLGWYDDAKAQLARLRETPLNNCTATKSTGRMAVRTTMQPAAHHHT